MPHIHKKTVCKTQCSLMSQGSKGSMTAKLKPYHHVQHLSSPCPSPFSPTLPLAFPCMLHTHRLALQYLTGIPRKQSTRKRRNARKQKDRDSASSYLPATGLLTYLPPSIPPTVLPPSFLAPSRLPSLPSCFLPPSLPPKGQIGKQNGCFGIQGQEQSLAVF